MKLKPAEIWARLNSTYWFVPLLMMLGAIAAVVGAVRIDSTVTVSDGWLRFLYASSPQGARALLSAAVGSIVTVVSVTFSVTVVALTVASQHFGPRLLDNFMRERGSKVVLGILIGTFVYCMILLSAIGDSKATPFVPAVALIGAVALLGVSVGALIYFVHHVARSIQIPYILDRIGGDLESSIERAFADEPPALEHGFPPSEPDNVATVDSSGDGYIQRIDEPGLVRAAERADAHVWVYRPTGDFVITGVPLLAASPARAVDRTFVKAVNDAYVLGPDRTTWQDPLFAVHKLVEVALRALSPAVNEPFTALACIDQLARGLSRAAARVPRPRVRVDASGRPRVYVPRHSFRSLLDAAFDPLRVFAGANPAIYAKVLATLALIAQRARHADQLDDLRRQARRCHETALERLANHDDRACLEAELRAAIAACDASGGKAA